MTTTEKKKLEITKATWAIMKKELKKVHKDGTCYIRVKNRGNEWVQIFWRR